MGLYINFDSEDSNSVSGHSCDELIQAGIARHVNVRSESGYRELVRKCPPPNGYVWKRSPFGSQPGWKAVIAEEPEIAFTDTKLEQDLRDHLQSWGYWEHFEQDYRKFGSLQLDFVDAEEKVVLEPGAVYHHTPDGCQGEAIEQVGEHPEDVYSPVTDSDLHKQKTLSEDGWEVLWMTEDGVRQQSNIIKEWLEQFYGQ